MEVAKRFGIGGYPLLLMFRYGKQYNYTGPREQEGWCTLNFQCCVLFTDPRIHTITLHMLHTSRASHHHTSHPETFILHVGIVKYMQKQAGPSSILLASVAKVRGFTDNRETQVVGFFTKDTPVQLVKDFQESGNLVREYVQLGHTVDKQVAKGMGFPVDSAVVFHPR